MFCSGCGQALTPGQGFCSQCGRPAGAQAPLAPGFSFQLESYAGKMKALSILWFIYAGLSLLLGIFGLSVARALFSGHFGPWMNGPSTPFWLGPAILHFVWIILALRIGLALVAGWGLWVRTEWGRIVAIIAAIFSLLRFPFGTALGVWTLIMLLGSRNSTLYEQL